MSAQPQPCHICGRNDETVEYCSLCRKWLCRKCARDYVARAKAVAREIRSRF